MKRMMRMRAFSHRQKGNPVPAILGLSWGKQSILMLALLFFGLTTYASMSQEVGNARLAEKRQVAGRVTLYSGSLKENLSRIATGYGWKKVVWLPETDYQWVGQVSMRKEKVYSLFTRVLQNYPLQAVFYKGNHVLVITPRNV